MAGRHGPGQTHLKSSNQFIGVEIKDLKLALRLRSGQFMFIIQSLTILCPERSRSSASLGGPTE